MADQAEQDERSQGGGNGGDDPPRSTAAARLAAKRAAKAAAKASKKGTAPVVPVGLADRVDQAGSWYSQHSRALWAVVLLVGLALVGWVAVSAHLSSSAAEAAQLLGSGVKTALAPVVDEGETPPEEVEESYPSERERAQKALDEYRAVLSKYPDSEAALWAKMGEANTLLELDKHDEAQQAFNAALERGREERDVYVEWRSLEGLGFALEAQGKHSEAASRFEELAMVDNGAYRVPADYHRARMLVALGKKDEAATLLEALIKAQRERTPEQGVAFESVLSDAETLLDALATELGKPKLEPKPSATGGPALGGQDLSPELMEALRKQLEAAGAQDGDQRGDQGGEGETQ